MDETIYDELLAFLNLEEDLKEDLRAKLFVSIATKLGKKKSRSSDEIILLSEILIAACRYDDAFRLYYHGAIKAMKKHDYFIKRFVLFLHDQKQYDVAYGLLLQALQYHPRSFRLINMLGVNFLLQKSPYDAEKCFVHYRRIYPYNFEVYCNMSIALELQGKYHEAKKNMQAALNIENMDANLHFGLGLMECRLGSFKKGSKMMLWRFINNPHIISLYHPITLWRGEDIQKKSLLVTTEQGFGDFIMYARFLKVLIEKYPDVTLTIAIREPLMQLFQSFTKYYNISITHKGDNQAGYDYFIPVMHLPVILDIEYEDIDRKPYIFIEETKVTHAKIGLCFKGKTRTIKESYIMELIDRLGQPIQLLQFETIEHPLIQKLPEDIDSFYQTATIINGLDYIITVDSSVAHLAGAMGKKVLLLNDYHCCWRWYKKDPTRENYSLWYEHMQVFQSPNVENDFRPLWDDIAIEVRRIA